MGGLAQVLPPNAVRAWTPKADCSGASRFRDTGPSGKGRATAVRPSGCAAPAPVLMALSTQAPLNAGAEAEQLNGTEAPVCVAPRGVSFVADVRVSSLDSLKAVRAPTRRRRTHPRTMRTAPKTRMTTRMTMMPAARPVVTLATGMTSMTASSTTQSSLTQLRSAKLSTTASSSTRCAFLCAHL